MNMFQILVQSDIMFYYFLLFKVNNLFSVKFDIKFFIYAPRYWIWFLVWRETPIAVRGKSNVWTIRTTKFEKKVASEWWTPTLQDRKEKNNANCTPEKSARRHSNFSNKFIRKVQEPRSWKIILNFEWMRNKNVM